MGTIQLLIASDYAMTRDGMRALLSRSPEIQIVGEAHSIADAPARFQAVQPDVILLEVSAPGSRALRSVAAILSGSLEARIVILTNIDDPSYVRAILAVGAFGYVLKQSPTEQLIASIHKAAENHRFIDPLLSDSIAELFGKKQSLQGPHLSNREEEVLKGIARGLSSRQLAIRLRLSTKTVETYRSRLYQKLQLHNRAELVNYAIAVGIMSAE